MCWTACAPSLAACHYNQCENITVLLGVPCPWTWATKVPIPFILSPELLNQVPTKSAVMRASVYPVASQLAHMGSPHPHAT